MVNHDLVDFFKALVNLRQRFIRLLVVLEREQLVILNEFLEGAGLANPRTFGAVDRRALGDVRQLEVALVARLDRIAHGRVFLHHSVGRAVRSIVDASALVAVIDLFGRSGVDPRYELVVVTHAVSLENVGNLSFFNVSRSKAE